MVSSVSSTSTPAWTTAVTSSAAQRHKDMFTHVDTNSDGKIDTLELSAIASNNGKGPDAAALMKQMDTNGDGSVSEAENETFLTAMDDAQKNGAPGAAGAPSGAKPSGPPPGGGGPGGGGMDEASSTSSTTKVYDKLDTNKDGKVSFEEMMAGMAKAAASTASSSTSSSTNATGGVSEADAKTLFKKIDANGDGSIDKTEFDAFTKKMEEAVKKQEAATATTYTATGDVNYEAVGSTINAIA